jgi:hypothetical protein
MLGAIKEYEQLLATSCTSDGADGVPNAAVVTADANGQSDHHILCGVRADMLGQAIFSTAFPLAPRYFQTISASYQ